MSEDNAADAQYLFGHSEEETRRLLLQGRLFNPYTRRLLEDAGITRGMKVLDVGSLDAVVGGGPEWVGYGYIASLIRTLLPVMVKFGVATAEEVGIDTLEERFRDEVVSQGGVVTTWGFITAWARLT